MKKYSFFLVLSVIGITTIILSARHGYFYSPGTDITMPTAKIIAMKADSRGLVSVEYIKGNDTLALDYLTAFQIDSLTHN